MRYIRAVIGMACSGLFFAAVVLLSFESQYGSGQVVYAVNSSLSEKSAPVRGMESSVESLRNYNEAIQTIPMSSPGEQVLVGTRYVSRYMALRDAFKKNAAVTSQMGRKALEEVTENQMPYEDYYTLLQIVEAEATGGDTRSKILVANVVLNRVKDEHFPDTVHEVVWEKVGGSAQFSPTIDGRIHSCEITNSTIDAVKRAIDGEDYSQGALYFAARSTADTSNMQWFDSKLVSLFAYGGHEFFAFPEE